MLEHRVLVSAPFARVVAVRCPGPPGEGPEEEVTAAAVVLLRRGVFRRRADGRRALVDVCTGYLQRPGECQRIAHPAGGDVCTSIAVPDDLADRLAHAGRVTVSARADLAHRRLLGATRGSLAATDPVAVDLAAVDLVAALIAELLPAPRAETPTPSGPVDDVRALVHLDPGRDLTALAAMVGWSPWHLSRMFHRATGRTLVAYRRALRVRAALDEIAGAATTELAAVATRHGFADQAHMTRAVRAETGSTPAALRRRLGQPDGR